MRKCLQLSILTLLLFALVPGTVFAQSPVTVTVSPQTRVISPIYYGYNAGAAAVVNNIWRAPELHKGVDRLHAGTIRFPGGTVANYWDWRTGWVIPDPDGTPFGLGLMAPVPNKLEDFKVTIDATGATPIFVLNVLSSSLQSQLEMLRHARSLGFDISYIELGNEFWLNEPDNVRKFPTGAAYGTLCSQWIPAIRAEFPNAKIAVVGAGPMSVLPQYYTDPRMYGWNQSVLSTLVGADALTIHFYEHTGLNNISTLTQAHVQSILGLPFGHWEEMKRVAIDTFPSNLEVWITEYNIAMSDTDVPIHGTWVHGLYDALYALLFLDKDQVAIADLHSLVGQANFGALFDNNNAFKDVMSAPSPLPVTVPYARSAAGFALSLLNQGSHGMTSSSLLSFNPNPTLAGGLNNQTSYPSLIGRSFSNGSEERRFIMNLSNTSFVYTNDGSMKQYEQWWANPTQFITNGNLMTHRVRQLSNTLVIPPYSTTLLLSTPMICPLDQVTSDLEPDGDVDIFDYSMLVSSYGLTSSQRFVRADINLDGRVDIIDYNLLVSDFGRCAYF